MSGQGPTLEELLATFTPEQREAFEKMNNPSSFSKFMQEIEDEARATGEEDQLEALREHFRTARRLAQAKIAKPKE